MATLSKQPEVNLVSTPVGVQPTPMEVSTAQMNLKTLLEAHVMDHPLENAFHG